MKNYDRQTFISVTIFVGLLLVLCFIAACAEDEGTLGSNIFGLVLAKLFYVFRFPTHTLFWIIISSGGAAVYFVGLFLNYMFYGLIAERLISLVRACS